MEGVRRLSAQRALPLLRLALLVLIACGGCSSGGEPSSTRRIRLAVKTDIADQRLSRRSLASAATAQPRQVGRGDPGFIARLDMSIQVGDLAPRTSSFTITETQQQRFTGSLMLPIGTDRTISVTIRVRAYNEEAVAIFGGEIRADLNETAADCALSEESLDRADLICSVTIRLERDTLIPTAAVSSDLAQRSFSLADGAAFGLPDTEVRLTFGVFTEERGTFVLTAGEQTAVGMMTLGSCTFAIAGSTFAAEPALQVDRQIHIDPCDVDIVDGRLLVQNVDTGARSESAPPTEVANALWGDFRWGEARWSN